MMVWLSFADPTKPTGEQFLGVAIIEIEPCGDLVETMKAAITKSHLLGLNPGGEVAMWPILPPAPLELFRAHIHRLLDRDELVRLNLAESAMLQR